ncbi:hypothetical protein ILYODFUR_016761 [Ilyodon furcidens]|uniref:Uncharacterized protein n=1 Tax=Ilyodon furcidens TaxID=33524 RepID=A0ABV0SXP9_9TELE
MLTELLSNSFSSERGPLSTVSERRRRTSTITSPFPTLNQHFFKGTKYLWGCTKEKCTPGFMRLDLNARHVLVGNPRKSLYIRPQFLLGLKCFY